MENYWLLLLCIGFVSGSSLSAHYSRLPYHTNDYYETRLHHILSGFEERIKDLEIYLDRYPYLESIIKIKTPEEWTDALNSILTNSDDAAGVTYVTDKDLYISIITPENNHPPLLLDPEGQYFDFVSNHILMDRYLKKAQELVSNNDPQVRQKLTIYILELAGQIDVTLDQNKYAYYLNVISNEAYVHLVKQYPIFSPKWQTLFNFFEKFQYCVYKNGEDICNGPNGSTEEYYEFVFSPNVQKLVIASSAVPGNNFGAGVTQLTGCLNSFNCTDPNEKCKPSFCYYFNIFDKIREAAEAVNPRGGQSAVVEEFNKELPTINASQDADAARAIRAFFSVLADLNFLFTGDGKTLGKIMDQYKHSGPEFIIRGDLPFNKLKPAGSQFQLLEKNG